MSDTPDAQVPTQPDAASPESAVQVEAEGQEQKNPGLQKRIDELVAKEAAAKRQIDEVRMQFEAQLAGRDELLKTFMAAQNAIPQKVDEEPQLPEGVDPAFAKFLTSTIESATRKQKAEYERSLRVIEQRAFQAQVTADQQSIHNLVATMGLAPDIEEEANKAMENWRARGIPDVKPLEAVRWAVGGQAMKSQTVNRQTAQYQQQYNANAGGFVGNQQAAPPSSSVVALEPLPDDILNHMPIDQVMQLLQSRAKKGGWKL